MAICYLYILGLRKWWNTNSADVLKKFSRKLCPWPWQLDSWSPWLWPRPLMSLWPWLWRPSHWPWTLKLVLIGWTVGLLSSLTLCYYYVT